MRSQKPDGHFRPHRRHFLRGLGACVTLPALESFGALKEIAANAKAATPATTATGAPLRMGFLYFPNGAIQDVWRPEGAGVDYKLNKTMKPIQAFRDDFQIISGFEHKNGWAGPDGAGDHARANATILTGARPYKTAGADIKLGVSVDQVAADHVKDLTRFPSLELSCDAIRKSGSCDSGYSCAYQYNLAWRTETSPLAPESNPRLVFERLFGTGSAKDRQRNHKMRQQQRRSILDLVMQDARQMRGQLGRNDQHKVDEYLTGIRDIERRIEASERFGPLPNPRQQAPEGVPDDYETHIRLMFDMLHLAYQTDSTRVATFLLAHDGSNRSFNEIGVAEGHHSLSHHNYDEVKMAKIRKIDLFYTRQFGYFLHRMKNTEDVDGHSLLHNSMILYTSGHSDASRHRHDNLPAVLAGHAGGAAKNGRHTQLDRKTPMTNLFVSMLNHMGVHDETFGDSDGVTSFT
ncbi:MAG: DUF1552 domain-containing protein [Planctomycetota bacterium]